MKCARLQPGVWLDRWGSVGFLAWFAGRNLWEKRYRRVTAASTISLLLVIALPLAVAGLVGGLEKRSHEELSRNRLNLCLWVRGGTNVVLTREKIAEVHQALQKTLGAAHLLGVHGFERTGRLNFKKKDGTSWWPAGQTAVWDDPILTDTPGTEGLRSQLEAATEGIVISRSALTELGFTAEERPKLLRVNGSDCRVLAIAQHDESASDELRDRPVLPQRLDYLITERLFLLLLQGNPQYDVVRLKPIPADWQSRRTNLPPGAKKLLKEKNVEISRDPNPDVWSLTQSGTGGWWHANWEEFVDRFAKAMAADKLPAPTESPPMLILPGNDVPPSPLYYSHMGIYTTDLKSLTKAATFCRGANLLFDDEVVRKLDEIGARSREILRSLWVIELLIGAVAGLNLGIIQYLRHRQRMAEIGMLKAMGMSRARLGWLAVVEGGMLWLGGTVLGLVGGCAAGWLIAWAKFGAEGLADGFRPPWIVFICIPLAAGVLSVAASLWGTAEARNTPPSETVHR